MKKYFLILSVLTSFFSLSSCSDSDEPMRMPEDILGVWSPAENTYLQFSDDNYARTLTVEYQDNQSIGRWSEDDVYYYDPGYNLVIYLTATHQADVYQIVNLDSNSFTWCLVDKIEDADRDSVGQIIGEIINKAQEGYKLNPELYQSFTKIPQLQFLELEESLDIIYYPDDPEEE